MEILVVDDGSTDRTPEIVRKFEAHVRLLRKTNGGQASAFNAGIPEARGEIVAFLDGDDWWAKEKMSVVVDYLEGRPHIGFVGHGIYEFDSATSRTAATIPQRARKVSFDIVFNGKFFRQMMCFFGTRRVSIRRNILSRMLPVPEQLVIEADESVSAYSAAGLILQPLTFYRLHADNLFQVRKKDETRRAKHLKFARLKAAVIGRGGPSPPLYWRLIRLSVTEQPYLSFIMNTSFNLRGEPIVCTPTDAIRELHSRENARAWRELISGFGYSFEAVDSDHVLALSPREI
jgi:glycosyltransferase involved in cell wall biosynthesis